MPASTLHMVMPLVVHSNTSSMACWHPLVGGSLTNANLIYYYSGIFTHAIHERRQADPLDSIPQYNFDMCHESLNGAKLTFTPAGPGSFQVAGVPSTCMVLATALTGSFNAGNPTSLGADSLKFTGLTDDEMNQLQSYFH